MSVLAISVKSVKPSTSPSWQPAGLGWMVLKTGRRGAMRLDDGVQSHFVGAAGSSAATVGMRREAQVQEQKWRRARQGRIYDAGL